MREPSKLQVSMWGIKINADGFAAIVAAVLIVVAVLLFWRF